MEKLQGDDEDINPVLAAKKAGEWPTNEQVSAWSHKAKRLLEHWDALEVHEGLLYRRWESADAKVTRRQRHPSSINRIRSSQGDACRQHIRTFWLCQMPGNEQD